MPLPGSRALCADISVPPRLVEALRDAGFSVRLSREEGVDEGSAPALFRWVRRRACVLLTLDRRYWSDAAYPPEDVPGIVLLDFPPGRLDLALAAFEQVHEIFGRTYTLDDWRGVKVLAGPERTMLKFARPDGGVKEYVVTRDRGLVYALPLNGRATAFPAPAPTIREHPAP